MDVFIGFTMYESRDGPSITVIHVVAGSHVISTVAPRAASKRSKDLGQCFVQTRCC